MWSAARFHFRQYSFPSYVVKGTMRRTQKSHHLLFYTKRILILVSNASIVQLHNIDTDLCIYHHTTETLFHNYLSYNTIPQQTYPP